MATGDLKQYDPAKVLCTFGAIILGGYAEDSMISVERSTDTWTKKPGVDGEVTRVRSRDRSGRATVNLMQSSAVNALLSAQLKIDEATGNGVFPFLLKHLDTLTVIVAAKGWIVKPPVAAYGKDVGPREWLIDLADVQIFEAGT